jgi:DNA-binding Lrp family transcriptional regulator
VRVDDIDLHIIRLLARDSRTSYRNIASAVGISTNAAKVRINKMISNGIIERFVVFINPATLGYEKMCFLIVKNIDKTVKEQDLFKKVSVIGNVNIKDNKQGEGIALRKGRF